MLIQIFEIFEERDKMCEPLKVGEVNDFYFFKKEII